MRPSISTKAHEKFDSLRNQIGKEENAIFAMIEDFDKYLQQFIGEDYLETFYTLMENPGYRCEKMKERTDIFFNGSGELKIIIEYKFGIIKECHCLYERNLNY